MYGGTCINIGCIPTKTLVHQAKMASEMCIRDRALAEFECYQYSDNTNDILEAQKFFTDETYSELKSTVTSESLKAVSYTHLDVYKRQNQSFISRQTG